MTYNVVLSGGVGSRLWPISRKSAPKQYLSLFGGKSMFELTLLRNQSVADACIVVGNKDNYELSDNVIKSSGITKYDHIVEAAPKNTAAAIAFACFGLAADDVLIVTPADHMITGYDEYLNVIEKGIEMAKNNVLVTFGIKPSKPETGYGYIEHIENRVLSFREKPDAATAQKFIESGSFLWNSGMFCFKAGVYLSELEEHQPDVFDAALRTWQKRTGPYMPHPETMSIPSISVDYAVMEKSENIRVLEADFGWSDLGSFDAIWDYQDSIAGSDNEMINMAMTTPNKHVEFVGIENLMVIETEAAILIMPRHHSQKVKEIYERLEKEKPELLK